MLTPKDIETKVFKISFRGYDTSEVDDFLQEICDSYLELYESNKKLKDDASRLSEAVGQYKSLEETITDAAKIADMSANDIEIEAKGKAKLIIENAELTANSIVAGAEQRVAEETYRLESIKREVELYKNKIVELLNAQLSVLKGYPQSGSIGMEANHSHTQQMWKKKTESNVFSVEEDPVKNIEESSVDPEKTRKFKPQRDIEDTDNLNIKKDTDTDKLPCIKMDADGKYIVSDNNK